MKVSIQCQGCGAFLQSHDPNALGYIPRQALESRKGDLICQRCYRIKHYGKDQEYSGGFDAEQIIFEGLSWAQGVVVILDLMDFEASVPRNIHRLVRKHQVVAVLNKVDLLPPRTTAGEAGLWARRRLHALGLDPDIVPVSCATGYGISELLAVMNRSSGRNWLVIGVTNSGKSSLITSMLKKQARAQNHSPTTSMFPGTTVALTRWELDCGIVLADSPGLVPKGRLTDLVCPDCAVKLIPARRLNVSVHTISSRSALVVPGFAAVQPLSSRETVLIGFTASEVSWRRANADKIPNWLAQKCGGCQLPELTQEEVTLNPNQDLYIHGLGWVSVRKDPAALKLTIPKGVDHTVRDNMIGAKAQRVSRNFQSR
jgi:ribosome biogenesis GTPase A